jgi:hypothetical protein
MNQGLSSYDFAESKAGQECLVPSAKSNFPASNSSHRSFDRCRPNSYSRILALDRQLIVCATRHANKQTSKSAWDAGWSALRTLLQYERDQGNIWFDEVDEAYSSSYTRGCCKGAPA